MDVIALGLHGIAATLWIGGIFLLSWRCVQPEEVLESQHRLILWRATYRNFFSRLGVRGRPFDYWLLWTIF